MASSTPEPAPSEPDYLECPDGRRLAYHKTTAAPENSHSPGVVFLGGFSSDMTGTKAQHLDAWAKATGRAFLRFDYTGHGQSSGAFDEGSIGDWARDAQDAIEMLTEGPQILVGSSMGGWISMLLIKQIPERVAGMVGIAAAPDFTEDAMWGWMSEAQKTELLETGRIEISSDYDGSYVITQRLIEDGRDNLVLRDPLRVDAPVRLLHGAKDVDVDMSVGLKLLEHMDCPDARLTLVKDGDHRLSEPRELALLTATVESLL